MRWLIAVAATALLFSCVARAATTTMTLVFTSSGWCVSCSAAAASVL